MHALIAFLPRGAAPNALQAAVNTRLLLFAFLLSVTAGVLTGLAPAFQAGRGSLLSSLRERSVTAFGGLNLRRMLVTAQIALTLILVIGGALFVRTLTALLAKGPGFDTSGLVSFSIDPVRNGYSPSAAIRLIRRIHEEIHASRNTQSSAIAFNPLLTGGSWNNLMTIQTNPRVFTDRDVHLNAVSPEFFATLGARIVIGRDFEERDTLPVSEGGRQVTIVNEAFVKRYFAGRNPLGLHIGLGSGPDVKLDFEVVGVMANISYRGVREESEQAYFPIIDGEGGNFSGANNFYVRIQGSAEAAFQSIRTILHNADPTLPAINFRTLDEQVSRSLMIERILAALSGSFGTLALLLSLVGLYGVMSFVVTQRTREIGVRVALGATRLSAVWLVLRDALTMTAAGIALALPCAWTLGRLIESQLYNVKPADPATTAIAILILSTTAVGAALIPAYRASAVNPTEALRFE
jgi:predicted permease